MRERGIIFNAEMVRAILDGRKTQTRRMFKVQPHAGVRNSVFAKSGFEDGHGKEMVCPLGDVGDRLWVRETWQGPLVDYDEAYSMFKNPKPYQKVENCVYRADGGPCPDFTDADDNLHCCWRPSAHMPRWASRITLEITGIRVERLNSISEDGAYAEGIELEAWDQSVTARNYLEKNEFFQCWSDCLRNYVEMDELYRQSFSSLWKSTYGEESWQANPWVWVIEFKRVEHVGEEGA